MSFGFCSPEQHSIQSPDIVPALYEGISIESSLSSLMDYNIMRHSSVSQNSQSQPPYDAQDYETIYGLNGCMTHPAHPLGYPTYHESLAPVNFIPLDLEIEELYEDYDRRSKNSSKKIVSSHTDLRRRAQNRASQRAFRDRKEKHIRELEQDLRELEGRHTVLSQAYKSLHLENSTAKQELDRLKTNNALNDTSPRHRQPSRDAEDSRPEILDPPLFDVSAFCFDEGDRESVID